MAYLLDYAFAAATVGSLNQISAAFNVLIIGLGVEFGIHFCMRYSELRAAGRPRTEALTGTGTSVGPCEWFRIASSGEMPW